MTVQSYQNRERNLKSWSSKAYSRRGDDGAVHLPNGEKTPLAHGAVQLSDAKAFSLDWKVLIQRQEFCRYGTNFGAVEISIV